MNILVVCRVLPYPPDIGYKIRTFNLIKRLSNKHNISLVCYEGSNNQETHLSRMTEYCQSIRLVQPLRRSKLRQLPGLAKDLISGLPWYLKYSKSKEMKNAIHEITKVNQFDILHIDDPYMAGNFDVGIADGAIKTVTFHDIESVKYRRMLKIEKNSKNRVRLFLNWLPMKRWEREIAERFDLCIVMSSADASILKSTNEKSKIAIIPNGVDTDHFKKLPFDGQERNISFFGGMDYPPNIDAALYFHSHMLPLIEPRLPGAKFVVVGQKPTSEILKLSMHPNTIVTGFVEDIIPYYRDSSVVVVPLRAGGGTRLKILEAMALGRPVVSTSIGCEGLDVVDGKHLLIADNPEQFVEKTMRILKDRELYQRIVADARQLVVTKYDWDAIGEKLVALYVKLTAQSCPKNVER
jgi:sugar transferase (PEP-CTERM/EpsH1 system associated)